MKQLLKEQKYYFSAFIVFIIVGAIALFQIQQGDLIHFFSERRSSFGDWFFIYTTKLGEAYLYAAFAILLAFISLRYALLIPLTAVTVLLISYGSKAFFAMDRPKVYFLKRDLFDQINTVSGVDLHVGATSFPSGHTMSAFALYTILAFLFAKKPWAQLTIFVIALLVGVSRIYLVQHFFQDVYLGAIMGVIIAISIYLGQAKLFSSPSHRINQPLAKIGNR